MEIKLLQIIQSHFRMKKWTNVTELPFDSDNYSTAHPALSDGKTLYFV
jgi:hypothetical protein